MAQTTPVPYEDLAIGDLIECGEGKTARVLRLSHKWTDRFGREMFAHWCADENGNEGWVPFGKGGIARKIN